MPANTATGMRSTLSDAIHNPPIAEPAVARKALEIMTAIISGAIVGGARR